MLRHVFRHLPRGDIRAEGAGTRSHGPFHAQVSISRKLFSPQQAEHDAVVVRHHDRIPSACLHPFTHSAQPVAQASGRYVFACDVTGAEHYVNLGFMADDTILDPDKPESLVFDTTVKPKKLVARKAVKKSKRKK